MRTVTTGAKAFMLLAATAALSVLGNASVSWAQYSPGGGGPGGGNLERCSLSGVNPADHPNIFSNPAVARSYGFVQVNGTWQVSPSLCGRRGARAQAAPASASAKASPAAAKGNSMISEGKCWLNTNGTNFRWGDCK
jgi:hypothetical protein